MVGMRDPELVSICDLESKRNTTMHGFFNLNDVHERSIAFSRFFVNMSANSPTNQNRGTTAESNGEV